MEKNNEAQSALEELSRAHGVHRGCATGGQALSKHFAPYVDKEQHLREENTQLKEALKKLDERPPYYLSASGGDVYGFLMEHFGVEAWRHHCLMEAVQYLLRCMQKGDMEGDLRKARVCIERILDENSPFRHGASS